MMAMNTTSSLFASLSFFFFLFVQSEACGLGRVAPPLYVFGDSVMDPGNNVFLNTPVKVNFTPYGIDFPRGPTGRFTNGYTIADFWYKWSNKRSHEPIPLPYLHPLSKQKSNTKGFNYASGTAGILPNTSRNVGENLPLGKQVKLFKETAEQYLPSLGAYNNRAKLSNALSKSIFVVCMGSNDYINYLEPGSNTSKLYNAEQFGEFLVNELGNHLQELYNLGARKFVVFEIAPLGCLPDVIDKTKPSTICDEQINGLVSILNTNLGVKLVGNLNGLGGVIWHALANNFPIFMVSVFPLFIVGVTHLFIPIFIAAIHSRIQEGASIQGSLAAYIRTSSLHNSAQQFTRVHKHSDIV